MSERKVNLEEISNNIVATGALANPNYKRSILDAMKEACRQALELAAEKIKLDAMETFGSDIPDCWDKQSILNTINQIE